MPEMTDAQLAMAREEMAEISSTIVRTVLGDGPEKPDARMLYITADRSLYDGWTEVKELVSAIENCDAMEEVGLFLSALKMILQNIGLVNAIREVKAYDCPHCKGPRPHCGANYGE